MDLRRGIERGEGERERERGDKLKIELFEDSRRWWIFLGAFYGRMESNDRLGVKFFLRDLELESLRNTHFSYMRLCEEIYLLFSSIEKRETTNEIIRIMRFFFKNFIFSHEIETRWKIKVRRLEKLSINSGRGGSIVWRKLEQCAKSRIVIV